MEMEIGVIKMTYFRVQRACELLFFFSIMPCKTLQKERKKKKKKKKNKLRTWEPQETIASHTTESPVTFFSELIYLNH